MVGWGSSFYRGAPSAEQFDDIIGQLDLRWYVTPTIAPGVASLTLSSIGVGFTRDFVNSFLADYYSRDRFYLSGEYFAGGSFLMSAEAGAALHGYSTPYQADQRVRYDTPTGPAGPFKETRVDATVFGEYRLSDSWGVNLTFRYSANLTNMILRLGSGETTDDFHLNWNRMEALLGVRWFL
jgi:hypothetical protein